MNNMKKCNKLIVLMLLLALALTVLAACDGDSKPVRLSPPINLQINGTTLTWDEVENATGYVVSVDATKKTATSNTYDLSALTESEDYSIRVMALGDGKKYLDSDWSQVKEYIVEPAIEQSLEFVLYPNTKKYYEVMGIGTITSNEIVVPATYNGKPVVNIGLRAFENNVNLTSVTLPDTIIGIKNFAFSGCTALESIDLPNSITNIQRGAFSGSGLKTLYLPDSVTSMMYPIFNDCLSLESIRLPEGGVDISPNFFDNTPKLKSITLPDSTMFISTSAFVGSSIESVKIPKNVQIIGESAFENTNINSVEFEEGSVLNDIRKTAFKGCNNLKSIVIPASVTTIGRNAFSDCANLKSVTFEKNSKLTHLNMLFYNSVITEFTIPKAVTTMESMAFDGLSTLETIRFEDNSGVTILPFQLFHNCTNLTTVDFGKDSKIETIDQNVFRNCLKLATINIPQSVTSIGYNAFGGDIAMKSIIIPSNVTTMGYAVFSGWTENQTIYIEGKSEAPAGWNSAWHAGSNAIVVWDFQSK